MNHTTNYQLNQWEAADKVRRVDFNADNAKIDAAIKAQADALAAEQSAREAAVAELEACSTWQLIKTETIPTADRYYMCPLSGVQWSDWREVMIVFQINMGENVYQVRPNGSSYDASIAASRYPMVMLLYPARLSSMPMQGISLGTTPYTFNVGASYSTVGALSISTTSGNTLPSGAKISFYGRK